MDVKNFAALARFDTSKMAKVNLFETDRFFMDLYCLLPGQKQEVHSHAANDKVYAVLRGEVRAVVGDESRTLHEGETTLAPAGAPHGVFNDSKNESVLLVFMAPHPKPRTNF